MKLEFSRRVFEKYWNVKYNLPVRTELLHTDRHDVADSRFLQFY